VIRVSDDAGKHDRDARAQGRLQRTVAWQSYGLGTGVGRGRGVGVGRVLGAGVPVAVAVAVGVGVGEPDCAQYLPPVLK